MTQHRLTSSFASLFALVAVAASPAVSADTKQKSFDAHLADQAILVNLDFNSSDPIKVGVANQALINCLTALKGLHSFQLPPAAHSGGALDSMPLWMVVDCGNLQAGGYVGSKPVVDSKFGELEDLRKRYGASFDVGQYGVTGEAGVVGDNDEVKVQKDVPTIRGSDSPGVGRRTLNGVLQPAEPNQP